MKSFLIVLFSLFAVTAWSQQDTAAPHIVVKHAAFERYSTIATLSAGFIDAYRQNYSLPEGYEKGNTSGFVPVYARLEYGVSSTISIAATMSYDAFVYNFREIYTGNSGTFTRIQTDNLRVVSGGIAGYYHLGSLFRIRTLDPFIGIGASLNNVRYNAYPQGDTAVIKLSHPVNAVLRVGARYYIAPQFSVFGDVGYDKQSVFSLGFSCRFFKTRKSINHDIDSDGDGVPDRIDACPHVKGLPQFNGCPDSDGDGIPDNRDACPTIAGPADNHGCPYDTATKRAAIAQVNPVIAIPKNVIRFLPATATFADSSVAVLDSLTGILKSNSKTDIAIASYTADAAGAQPVSKKVANARAVAVKKYLTDKGIAVTRLVFTKQGAEGRTKKHRELISLRYDITY